MGIITIIIGLGRTTTLVAGMTSSVSIMPRSIKPCIKIKMVNSKEEEDRVIIILSELSSQDGITYLVDRSRWKMIVNDRKWV
jgi:dihydropteroate synthase